jgi:uncharacterized membrane protein
MPLLVLVSEPRILLPHDLNTNVLMLLRWVHFLAGITWIGLLYFFNLVNVGFMKELDPAAKSKAMVTLMPRALWWFRWAAAVTVLAGLAYWMRIAATDARNAQTTAGTAFWSFFVVWTVAFAIEMAMLMALRNIRGPWLALVMTVVFVAAAWLFLAINSHGWESNRTLAIGIGGGMGWFMMFNVWGVVWRAQKKIIRWTAADPGALPPEAARLARLAFLASRLNAFLSIPMLFFMGAASHYPMFGK